MKRLGTVAGREDAVKIGLHVVGGLNRAGGADLDSGFGGESRVRAKAGGEDNDVAGDRSGAAWFNGSDTFAEREFHLKPFEMLAQPPRELRVVPAEHVGIGVDHGDAPCVGAERFGGFESDVAGSDDRGAAGRARSQMVTQPLGGERSVE